MKQRDRVLAALNFEETDRVPFQATFTPEFADNLRKHFGLPAQRTEPHHREWYGYDLEILTGQDALQVGIGWVTNYYLKDVPYTDNWGVKWKIDRYETLFGEGHYTNLLEGPLYGDDPDVAAYQAPDPNEPGLYDHLERLIREYQQDYFIIGRIHGTIFETAWALRGFEDLLMDMLVDEDLAGEVLDITFNYHLEVARNMARREVDMIWLGDDFGSQNSLLLNPDTWDRLFKPRYAKLIAECKAIKKDIKMAIHSDGCVYDIIPGLIDIGMDVLNPIQTECMDPKILKNKYGKNMAFFGGMAVQSTLPMGTKDDIRKEFEWLKGTLGKGGGWMCAPTHHVQLDTPIENFLELCKIIQSK